MSKNGRPWTEEERDTLRRARATGASYATVSILLPGRSRNACIGEGARMGLSRPKNPTTRLPGPPKRVGRPRIEPPRPRVEPPKSREDPLAGLAPRPWLRSASPLTQALLDLRDDQCRWPEGDAFCSNSRVIGAPRYFCEHHQVAAVRKKEEEPS